MTADPLESVRAAEAVVIGAGQAGLAVSHQLTELAVDHVILERARVAEAWRGRWDSFALVTPNWSIRLPGMPTPNYPDGFLTKAETIAMLESYATSNGSRVFRRRCRAVGAGQRHGVHPEDVSGSTSRRRQSSFAPDPPYAASPVWLYAASCCEGDGCERVSEP